MTEYKKFVVGDTWDNEDRWANGHMTAFDTMEKAEEYARKEAFKGGADHGIYQLHAIAAKPSIVNDVKITAVQ